MVAHHRGKAGLREGVARTRERTSETDFPRIAIGCVCVCVCMWIYVWVEATNKEKWNEEWISLCIMCVRVCV